MGVCPKCLLAQGMKTDEDPASSQHGKQPKFEPPSPEEVARQLSGFDDITLIGHGGSTKWQTISGPGCRRNAGGMIRR
jgi:hypothetical protein